MSQLLPFLTDEDLPPSKNKLSPLRWIVTTVLLLGLLAGGVYTFAQLRGLRPADDVMATAGQPVVIVIETGDSLSEVAQRLVQAGVVSSATAFLASAELNERATGIGPGVYTLRTGMDPASVIDAMLDPASRAAPLVLPEGLRPDETVQLTATATGLPAQDLSASLARPTGLNLPEWAEGHPEGLLFPASYDLIPGRTADEVLGEMVQRFDIAAEEVNLVKESKKIDYSPYEVLTVASLVEAEAGPDDMAKVARVIYNRLDQGMKLQLDSTVNYALKQDTFFITEEMLKTESPYNTFVIDGLPPTPINSPGQAAIEAALHPAKGDWLYFVTTDPDTLTTKFTADYDQFLKWKKQFKEQYAATASPSAAS